jgi:hypothetical protein
LAYLRKDEEKVEISYSLDKVWIAALKVLKSLGWYMEHVDETTHKIKVKTTAGPMSWSSIISIEAVSVSETATRIKAASETPVTMITAIVDFRQGKRRILQFLGELSKQLAG